MAEHRYSAEQVDAAVAAIADGERFADAQEVVTHAAPGLQQILGAALDAGHGPDGLQPDARELHYRGQSAHGQHR